MIDRRRELPAVHAIIDPAWLARWGQARVTEATRAVLTQARQAAARGALWPMATLRAAVVQRLAVGLTPVINATGVVLHTNLGRAPWCRRAIAAAATVSSGYAAVELDLQTGQRGGRGAGVRGRLQALVGAEDALVVNNCAAAVMLALTAVAHDGAVLISRGELVEIGGGFRVPDVITATGARLVEVGTTNRTHLRDFEGAIDADTAAIVRVHHSNFRQIGFTHRPALAELCALAPPVIVDQGSGALFDDEGDTASVRTALAAGAALVCFSGDKLLGGPQAGIIVGAHAWVERLRRHPLMRALRVDKTIYAALEGTLDAWATDADLPVQQMRTAPLDDLRAEVQRWQAALEGHGQMDCVSVDGTVGGGSLPGRTWQSYALAIRSAAPDALAEALRAGDPPVIGRVHQGALLLDARTVQPLGQGDALIAAVRAAMLRLA